MSAEQEMHPLLVEMHGVRNEMAVLREQNAVTFKRLGDILNAFHRIESTIRDLQSDLVVLENRTVSRHNEIVGVVARLDQDNV